MPNGGRVVRRHDDGDENERRRCCGHSEHAARTFGACVREEEEKVKRKGKKKGEERNKERKGEREVRDGDQRGVQAITYIQQCSRHMHARPLGSYHSMHSTFMCPYANVYVYARVYVYAYAFMYTCDAYTHRTYVRLHREREREMGARRTRVETPPTSDSIRLKRLADTLHDIRTDSLDSAQSATPPIVDLIKLYSYFSNSNLPTVDKEEAFPSLEW